MFEPHHYRQLGQDGPMVSPVGLGTVKIGRNQGVKYPSGFEIPDDEAVLRLLDHARALGINLLDTAPAYGVSEERLGELLADPREWVICTKVGEYFVDGASSHDFSRTATILSVEHSLRVLHREALDLVLVHSDGNDLAIVQQSDVLAALLDLKEQGKVMQIGFSGKDLKGSEAALPYVDVMMITLNPGDTSQLPLIEACQQAGKGVLIKKALASGHATDPDAAMRFAAGTPGVTSVIAGTINPRHLEVNVQACIKAA